MIGAYRYAWQPPETGVKLLGLHKPEAFPGSYGCVRGRTGDRRSDGVISNVPASAAHRAYRWTAILRAYGWLWPRYGLYSSEEHTSELQSLMLISYAVFRLKKQLHYRP